MVPIDIGSLEGKSPAEVAELTLSSGALNDTNQIETVFQFLENGDAFHNVDEFLTAVTNSSELPAISIAVRDIVMNLTFNIISTHFPTFDTADWEAWFKVKLVLVLPSFTAEMLTTTISNIGCTNYQVVVEGVGSVFGQMETSKREEIAQVLLSHLKETAFQLGTPACWQTAGNDSVWLRLNLGPFTEPVDYSDLSDLNITGVNVVDLLTEAQLSKLASTPTQIKSVEDVQKIMAAVTPSMFASFFDIVSPVIQKLKDGYTAEVKNAFLQAIFTQGDLTSPSISDTEILTWLTVRLPPFLTNLQSDDVKSYFSIINQRSCNIVQEGISILNSVQSYQTDVINNEIYSNIELLLKVPQPLRCYENGSFYQFLNNTFLQFGLPNLSTLLSLMPLDEQTELLKSMTPSELSAFLNQPSTKGTDLCTVFSKYNRVADYLEQESIPGGLRLETLSCVWPEALSATSQAEVDQWFDISLSQYLNLLNKELISPSIMQKATCLSYKKLILILGSKFDYSSSNFTKQDVYHFIQSYLQNSGAPKCFDANDPTLNSKDWFVNYISAFITYVSLDDLNSFVNTSEIKIFLDNPSNMNLFNNSAISTDVITYYVTQLYTWNPDFSVTELPGLLLCAAPTSAFTLLGNQNTMDLLSKLKLFCNGTNPGVITAVVSNIPVSQNVIQVLGAQSTGLTEGQISTTSPSTLVNSLSILSNVSGWNQGQANAIISIIIQNINLNTASMLVSLGTLIEGVPSRMIASINPQQLLQTTQNNVFVTNMLAAPQIIQQTYVNQIISIDQSVTNVLGNVPDALAALIPRVLLVSSSAVDVAAINQKVWTSDQAVVFFNSVASATNNTENLSVPVLQGFSCSSLQSVSTQKVKDLIKSCRPRSNRNKVQLKETQLTCMFNYVKGDASQNFGDFPSDMLLYYNYNLVAKSNCRSYFTSTGLSDFSVLSSVLNIPSAMLSNAKDCLGITGNAISKDNLNILGNMACTLDYSHIVKSDPFILEKLKNCNSFTADQVSAMETVLLSGKTTYGNPSKWSSQTLKDLANLPLYLTQNFWKNFAVSDIRTFLQYFLPVLQQQNVHKSALSNLFVQCSVRRARRGAGCITGNITDASIRDNSFPFGYDAQQFDLCLDAALVTTNLGTLTPKVYTEDLQAIILSKLNQVYPGGLQDAQLQLLGPTSRVATTDDIRTWNITTIDSLSALMLTSDGAWDPAKSNAIIMRYLNKPGTALGTRELNAIGTEICSLNTSVLRTIGSEALRMSSIMDISSCSTEQKSMLYNISMFSYRSLRASSVPYYLLIVPYLGGAPLADIQSLATQNVNMDINTFRSLNPVVITSLTVSDVKGLLGPVNLNDLKTFENDSVVRSWISQQYQSDLNQLGLGLSGGKASPITAAPTQAATQSSSQAANQTASQASGTQGPGTSDAVALSQIWSLPLGLSLLLLTQQMNLT
ncbi:uncharacterized protein LOC114785599 isoform X2 [Denticeps clupeoides]|uniref:uncharacterized protein LOC114785599 isoform X1 n=1 Tax=Denticeps clupeoides TaxID=299321 RepID=UPI0010A59D79|nr:uncharacterized protein LOC114785599 isoform X1 [Denticeps clupeoides]XP_028827816.1 uncharacterized protein LOC114785599 isoform X2 [Denticeps clupeoides]